MQLNAIQVFTIILAIALGIITLLFIIIRYKRVKNIRNMSNQLKYMLASLIIIIIEQIFLTLQQFDMYSMDLNIPMTWTAYSVMLTFSENFFYWLKFTICLIATIDKFERIVVVIPKSFLKLLLIVIKVIVLSSPVISRILAVWYFGWFKSPIGVDPLGRSVFSNYHIALAIVFFLSDIGFNGVLTYRVIQTQITEEIMKNEAKRRRMEKIKIGISVLFSVISIISIVSGVIVIIWENYTPVYFIGLMLTSCQVFASFQLLETVKMMTDLMKKKKEAFLMTTQDIPSEYLDAECTE